MTAHVEPHILKVKRQNVVEIAPSVARNEKNFAPMRTAHNPFKSVVATTKNAAPIRGPTTYAQTHLPHEEPRNPS